MATTTPIGRTSGPGARLAGRCSQAPSADSADGPPGSAGPARPGEGASSRPASKGRKDERRGDDRRCMGKEFQPCRLTGRGCWQRDRKSTRLNSSHLVISYAVFCLKKKKKTTK